MLGESCALCEPYFHGGLPYAENVIDAVPLCTRHARIVAMKRLGVTEADLSPAESQPKATLVRQLCDVVRELADPTPCEADHHGNCRVHGGGNPCAHPRAYALIAALGGSRAVSSAEQDGPESADA